MSENANILPQIKVQEPEPSDDKPWADDKLARKACADKLTAVIQGQIAPMTISVNGEWGSGKTFMLKRWQKQLSKDGYTAIYFNAWEDDFLTDPLVAILGQLQSVLISKLGEQVKKELSVGFKLVRNGVLRFVTAGCVDPADLEPERNLLDDYADGIASRAELKEALEKLIAQLPQNKLPLVFIVDELDRCRPTFAIEVLERIKHLFNIEHMVFVLGIDRENLGKSVQSEYGDINVEHYLHRFFDFDFRLPPTPSREFVQVLWEKYSIAEGMMSCGLATRESIFSDGKDDLQTEVDVLFSLHEFSLREIEQAIKMLALYIKTREARGDLLPLVPILCVLKVKNPALYSKFVNASCSAIEVIDFLLFSRALPFDDGAHPGNLPDTSEIMVLIPSIILAVSSGNDSCHQAVTELPQDVSLGLPDYIGLPEGLKTSKYLSNISREEQSQILNMTCYILHDHKNIDVFGLRYVHEQLNVFGFRSLESYRS